MESVVTHAAENITAARAEVARLLREQPENARAILAARRWVDQAEAHERMVRNPRHDF